MSDRQDPAAAFVQERWLTHRLRRWANARERRNPFGHGKTGTALLREAADRIDHAAGVVLLYPWGEDESVFYRACEDDEWVELERLADGETFPLPVGSSVRLDAPTGVGLEMW